MKVVLEKQRCIGCGTCSALCPDYFELADEGRARIKGASVQNSNDEIELPEAGCTAAAAESCPVECIRIIKL